MRAIAAHREIESRVSRLTADCCPASSCAKLPPDPEVMNLAAHDRRSPASLVSQESTFVLRSTIGFPPVRRACEGRARFGHVAANDDPRSCRVVIEQAPRGASQLGMMESNHRRRVQSALHCRCANPQFIHQMQTVSRLSLGASVCTSPCTPPAPCDIDYTCSTGTMRVFHACRRQAYCRDPQCSFSGDMTYTEAGTWLLHRPVRRRYTR